MISKWLPRFGFFIFGMALGFTIQTYNPFSASKIEQETNNQVVAPLCQVIQTNQVDDIEGRTSVGNTSWFTDGSKYIWDGWKIK